MQEVLKQTEYEGLPLISRGKVRDMYDLGDDVLIVVTDRLSAFDHVLPNGIPDKGRVLNLISAFWFDRTAHIVPNHLKSIDTADLPEALKENAAELAGRFTIAHKADMLPVECIVRGYLSGSGWKDYRRTGAVCGIELPGGLVESDRLPEPIFTPSTKADLGHDENISFEQAAGMVGEAVAVGIRDTSLALYRFAAGYALERGIIIADTKFEFGMLDGRLTLCDEALTPDSSRFWPADRYEPGKAQPSFDKQYVRDYLLSINWDREPPIPTLPDEVVENTSSKYREAYRLITGQDLS
ncbi:MAG: phosphoribosylaminoimidazolesuccinocarboxamide synthase [Deltaproteobacteria bacterium]|nr:phosphoribosylaminoimidazolesuccinocarboxamide synthase [Deltaproteobacteria bacterium]